jgi:ubiquinone/menaquinone biosynthesis C-methylase UbiE
MLPSPVFVVGSPRSGTTLLQCVLAAHSQIFSLPETHFFYALRVLKLGANAKLSPERFRKLLNKLVEFSGIELADFTKATLLAMSNTGELAPQHVFEAIIELHQPDGDTPEAKQRLVEKTPLHVLCLPDITKVYADSKFINVVRNPLDVAASWKRTPFAASQAIEYYIEQWTTCIEAAEAFEQSRAEHIQTVRYEDLILQPKAVTERLCRFLDVPFEEQMLSSFAEQVGKTVRPDETWKALVRTGKFVDRRGGWREALTTAEAYTIERKTASHRQKYDYKDEVHPSLGWKVSASGKALARRSGAATKRFGGTVARRILFRFGYDLSRTILKIPARTDKQAEVFPDYVQQAHVAKMDVNDWLESNLGWIPALPILEQTTFPYLTSQSVVCELGAGTGRWSRHLAPKLASGQLYLVDHSSWSIDFLKGYFQDQTNVHCQLSNGSRLPFDHDQWLDLIFAQGILTELKLGQVFQYAKEFQRVLKTGGRCIFDYVDPLTSDGWNYLETQKPESHGVFTYHTQATIEQVLQATGFSIEKSYSIGKSTYVVARKL